MGGSILTNEEQKQKNHNKYLAQKARKERSTYYNIYWNYRRCYYKNFPYDKLDKISYIKRPGRVKDEDKDTTFNDIIIMADTETSRKKEGEIGQNHVVAWTISLRAYGKNICTLYGTKPSEMCDCIEKLQEAMKGDKTIIYFHNMPYDWIFLRKFLFQRFGAPCKQLNVKPFYPIYIEFPGGLVLRDSLILSQCGLEKWANDLDVAHKKSTGLWDYDKLRDQNGTFSEDELEYIEHDTLAGVECIDKLMSNLGKKICSMPWTMTGIVREEVKAEGKKHHYHDQFLKMLPTWEQQLKLEAVYHGGFTHGNRHFYGKVIRTADGWDWVEGYDFSSSYPYVLLSEKFPMEAFHEETDPNITVDDILESSDQYAYMFKLTLIGVELISDNMPMPSLQFSKCIDVKNPVLDNGRIVQASMCQIYMNEVDLKVFASMYKWQVARITECEVAYKDYLPRWFTDLVYKLFKEKTFLKGGDPVQYALAKGRLNSLYGMCCQHPCKPDIVEDYEWNEYGEIYSIADISEAKLKEKYKQYGETKSNVLNYQIGVWVTSYAMRNLFRLGACIDYKNGGEWFYSDTDSIYCVGMNKEKLKAYNDDVKQKLLDRGYGPVIRNDREYWLGIAEHDELEDAYSEFKFMGAKRYVGRCKADGELHLTCAGVPKKEGVKCLHDDIGEFYVGKIFDGITTGKLTHTHFIVPDIYLDEHGNETGDSIDLSPCDYKLSQADLFDWDPFEEEIEFQIYDESYNWH